MTWALDLDGVIWRGGDPIDGSADAVTALRERGHRVVFLTNNSHDRIASYVEKLQKAGIVAEAHDVVSSGQAAASLLEEGTTALVCAGPGVEEALSERGVRAVREGDADAVIVGWHPDFDFERLTAAACAVWGGARLIGTNDDATYPTADGQIPGGGSLLSAVAYATATKPEVAGKPHAAMVKLVEERMGPVEVMVGDRPNTDGLLAQNMRARFALVLSGVTDEDDLPVEPEPELVAPNLAAVVERWAPAEG